MIPIITSLGSLLPTIASFASQMLPTLAPYIAKGIEIIQVIGKVAQTIAHLLQIFQPDDQIDEMGERALQAVKKGITPDQYDTHSDYVNAVRQFEVDPKISHEPIQKILAGVTVVSQGMDHHLGQADGTAASLWQLVGANQNYFTPDRLNQYIQAGQSLSDVVSYFTGKLDGQDEKAVEDGLIAVRSKSPSSSDVEKIRSELHDVRDQAIGTPG